MGNRMNFVLSSNKISDLINSYSFHSSSDLQKTMSWLWASTRKWEWCSGRLTRNRLFVMCVTLTFKYYEFGCLVDHRLFKRGTFSMQCQGKLKLNITLGHIDFQVWTNKCAAEALATLLIKEANWRPFASWPQVNDQKAIWCPENSIRGLLCTTNPQLFHRFNVTLSCAFHILHTPRGQDTQTGNWPTSRWKLPLENMSTSSTLNVKSKTGKCLPSNVNEAWMQVNKELQISFACVFSLWTRQKSCNLTCDWQNGGSHWTHTCHVTSLYARMQTLNCDSQANILCGTDVHSTKHTYCWEAKKDVVIISSIKWTN